MGKRVALLTPEAAALAVVLARNQRKSVQGLISRLVKVRRG